jgi:hypothetical protein
MFKIFVFVVQFFISVQVFASNSYVGTWCHRFDDFTSVLVINNKDQAFAWSIGNAAGENTVMAKGYVSLGATSFNIYLDNQDLGIVDFKIGQKFFSNKKTLILFSNDGTKETFTECKLIKK